MMTECSRITDTPTPTLTELDQKAVQNKNIQQQQPNRQENRSQLYTMHYEKCHVMKDMPHLNPSKATLGKQGEGEQHRIPTNTDQSEEKLV